jgi:hypothetical protein
MKRISVVFALLTLAILLTACSKLELAPCKDSDALDNFAMRHTPYVNATSDSEEQLDKLQKEVNAQRMWAEKLPDYCQRAAYIKWLDVADYSIQRGHKERARERAQQEFESNHTIPIFKEKP